jgi:hypothetical protein
MLTNLRQRLFAADEPQQMLHLGRQRDVARKVLVEPQFVRWAKARGVVVRESNGQEMWRWPDDSAWELSSLDGVYGRTANLVLMDEVWDISRRQYFEGVQPTMAARPRAQVWFFSAAHRQATELTPLMMARAVAGRAGYALFDWGALEGEDLGDPHVWRLMGPHWDSARSVVVSDAAEEVSFREQWANVWPPVEGLLGVRALPGWAGLPDAGREPARGGVVAVDEARDGARFGVLRLVGGSRVFYRETADLGEAARVADTADSVVVGLSMVDPLVKAGMRATPARFGVKELRLFTPLLQQAVAGGWLAHDHDPVLNEQASGARLVETEAGRTLSARKSDADVLGPKLVAWCLGFTRANATPLRARIF